MNTLIPKKIHYCWLSGDEYPILIKKCIESWQKHLPDYEIVLWDTSKIDVSMNYWLNESFNTKKYAFAADYIRFYALNKYGGIYLDADVEVTRSFDDLLIYKSFIGLESSGDFEAAIIGSVPGEEWTKKMLDYYEKRKFIKDDQSFDMKPLPLVLSQVIKAHCKFELKNDKLQLIYEQFPVFPASYFSPKNIHTKKIEYSLPNYAIHHFDGSWVQKTTKRKLKDAVHKMILKIGGNKLHRILIKLLRNG